MSPPRKAVSARRPAGPAQMTLRVDGACRGNPGPAGIGALLTDGAGRVVAQVSEYLGEATNNVAEFCALIAALEEAQRAGAASVAVLTDSELLARQVTGLYRVKDKQLQWLHALILRLARGFQKFEIRHVPREENRQADRLANRAVSEWLKRHPPARRGGKQAPLPEPAQPTLF